MKYYLIVGEASGDMHASHLMAELLKVDSNATFRFFGGEKMQKMGGTMVRNYKDLAFMGFIPVLLNLPTILKNMRFCKEDIVKWSPDVVILVDYPGFNLKIAKYIKKNTSIPIYYYISPKIWAWKEYRIKNIKRDVSEMFSILPFEVDFYKKHDYPIHYIGNPTVDEITHFKHSYHEDFIEFASRLDLPLDKPILSILAGSRKQEIKDNLPLMLKVASKYPEYQVVIAGAPNIESEYYDAYIGNSSARLVFNETYPLLSHSYAALVTSGTATLETALFNVPQVVCYATPIGKIISFLRKRLLKVKYISLVNLIVDKLIIQELVADTMNEYCLNSELFKLLKDQDYRQDMLDNYKKMSDLLGEEGAPRHAAAIMFKLLKN